MLVITGLRHAFEQNKVFKFTFFDKYLLLESSCGARRLCPFTGGHVQCMISPENIEQILFNCFPGAENRWYLVPTGTFDKILEHVYNFKDVDLLN